MAVKDLVGLFEAQSPPESSRSSRRVSFRRRSHSPTSAPQTPARFLRHPLLSEEPRPGRTADGLPRRNMTSGPVRELDAVEDLEMHDPPGDDTVVSQRHTDSPEVLSFTRTSSRRLGDMSTDVTDERLYLESNAPESSRRNSTTVIGSSGAEYEMHSFLAAPRTTLEASHSSHVLRPRSPFRSKSDATSLASTSTAVQSLPALPRLPNDALGIHHPIPATTVFARSALPLSLPALDRYISRLPPPSLPSIPPRGKGKEKYYGMFPPLDQLEATGRTIEDLENNSVVSSWWKNRNSILSSLVNGALGVTVSQIRALRFPQLTFFRGQVRLHHSIVFTAYSIPFRSSL